MTVKAYNNNCFEVLKTIPDASIDFILTDPPVLCQKNKNFIPEIGEKVVCLGKIKIIKGETYIQMGEVYFDGKGIQQ